MSDYMKQKLIGLVLIIVGGLAGILVDFSAAVVFIPIGIYMIFAKKNIFDEEEWD